MIHGHPVILSRAAAQVLANECIRSSLLLPLSPSLHLHVNFPLQNVAAAPSFRSVTRLLQT